MHALMYASFIIHFSAISILIVCALFAAHEYVARKNNRRYSRESLQDMIRQDEEEFERWLLLQSQDMMRQHLLQNNSEKFDWKKEGF